MFFVIFPVILTKIMQKSSNTYPDQQIKSGNGLSVGLQGWYHSYMTHALFNRHCPNSFSAIRSTEFTKTSEIRRFRYGVIASQWVMSVWATDLLAYYIFLSHNVGSRRIYRIINDFWPILKILGITHARSRNNVGADWKCIRRARQRVIDDVCERFLCSIDKSRYVW